MSYSQSTRTRSNTPHTADELRAMARASRQASADSFDRCDTDGFLSQWASDVTATEHELTARLVEADWKWEFPALFDLDGNLVAAKVIETKFGTRWALLASDDPRSRYTGFVNYAPARKSTLERKGYREGWVKAEAYATLGGGSYTSVRAVARRADGGFSRDVEIVDNGL